MKCITRATRVLAVLSALLVSAHVAFAEVIHDATNKSVTMSDAGKNLILRLSYHGKCLLDRVRVHGRELVPATTGVCTGIPVAGQWHTTRTAAAPKVTVTGNTVVVKEIVLARGGMELGETWTFVVNTADIVWRIEREYRTGGTLDDTYLPGFDFNGGAWTGALLGTGGVAWFKLFDTPVASYGVHTGPVTFWSKEKDSCLRLQPATAADRHLALRFSRHPHGVISCNYSATEEELNGSQGTLVTFELRPVAP